MRRHPRSSRIVCGFIACLTLALAASPALAGWSTQPMATTPLAPTPTVQRYPVSLADGVGGAFIAWQDARNDGSWDVYVQHVLANGNVDPAWPALGAAACIAPGQQSGIRMIADGTGGVILAWTDERVSSYDTGVYAQRLTATGAVAPGWPANGVAVAATVKPERNPSLCSDGAGGAIVTWEHEYAGGDIDIFAARVTAGGAIAFSTIVYNPVSNSIEPVIASDMAGGCYVAFGDYAGPGSAKVFATHLDPSGIQVYPPTVFYSPSPAVYDQRTPLICRDGLGGAFIAWTDYRTGDGDVYVSRIGPTAAPQQPYFGNALWLARRVGAQEYAHSIAYDEVGGAIVTWVEDSFSTGPQVFAHRVLTSGQFASGWPVGGIALGPSGATQYPAELAPDGTGGAVFAWQDFRNGSFGASIYGTRLTSAGTRAPRWSSTGDLVAQGNWHQPNPTMCTDGRRGAILAYASYEMDPAHWQIYVQRVDRYGALGDAEPRITSVRDVGADQGGRVRLSWNASYLDVDPEFGVGSYWIWRQTPVALAVAAVTQGARWVEDGVDDPESTRLFRPSETASAQYAWEFVASQPANGFAEYSYVAATTTDSTGAANPRTVFMVEAHAASGPASWASAPDSGYSVDNLAPAMPAPLAANYTPGTTYLHWGRNTESDLDGYRLYRGASPAFVPGPSNLVATLPDTGYADAGAAGAYYKLSAVDIHGNESIFAVVGPGATTDTPADLPLVVALGPMTPNPAREGSSLRLALPRASGVRLSVHDARGRLVRTLVDAALEPGVHAVRWDGKDDAGRRLPNGLYFTRLVAGDETRNGRFVVVE